MKIFGLRIGLDEVEYLIKSNFSTDCVCAGNDDLLKVMITTEPLIDQVRDFVIEKTHLFHKKLEVTYIEEIKRNEAGKVILH